MVSRFWSSLSLMADIFRLSRKYASLVPPMARAAAACGCDGLLIEVHNDPLHALCDGGQALLPEQFARLSRQVSAVRRSSEL